MTVQYGSANVGDLNTVAVVDALFNNGIGVDYTGWARFSLTTIPQWAVVTGINVNLVPQGSSGSTSLIVYYSANDNWSRDQNPKAANIPRTTVVSNGPVPVGPTNILQAFPLNLSAHDFNQDIEEMGSTLTLGVSNTVSGEAVFYGADSSNRFPSADITTCE